MAINTIFRILFAVFLSARMVSSFAIASRKFSTHSRYLNVKMVSTERPPSVDSSLKTTKVLSIKNTPDIISPFFRPTPSSGAGLDERHREFPTEAELDKDADRLSAIDLSYHRFAMSAELASPLGTMNKASIALNGAMVGTIPYPSGGADSATATSASSFTSGGLMSDWSFEM